jgi:hypothetical protein
MREFDLAPLDEVDFILNIVLLEDELSLHVLLLLELDE